MVNKCCVPLCKSTSYTANVSLHKFATNPKLRKAWIIKIRRDTRKSKKNPQPFSVNKSSKICSQHFVSSDFLCGTQRKQLKSKAVPTIFPWTSPAKATSRRSNKLELRVGDSEVTQPNIQEEVTTEMEINLELSEIKIEPSSDLNAPLDSLLSCTVPEAPTVKLETNVASPQPSLCCSNTSTESQSDSRNEKSEEVSFDYPKKYFELVAENVDLKEQLKWRLKSSQSEKQETNAKCRFFSLQHFKHSDKRMFYYTGFFSYEIFTISLNILFDYNISGNDHLKETNSCQRKMSKEDQYLIALMKLRQNFDDEHLAELFKISTAAVGDIFISWVNFMYVRLASMDIWPHRDVLMDHCPEEVKEKYPNMLGHIYAAEFFVQSSPQNSSKSTRKALIAADCNGAIIFISALFAGSTSDNRLVEVSGFARVVKTKVAKGYVLPNDIFLADKGYTVHDLLNKPVELKIPVFRCRHVQFTTEEVNETNAVARVHVEKAIRQVKSYKILSQEVPISFLGTFNQIWTVCCLLTNFRKPVEINEECNE